MTANQSFQLDDLSEDQLKEYKEAFALFDKDGDGSITIKELETVMRSLGMNPSDTELQKMLAEMDSDGNGDISFEEFIMILRRKLSDEDSPDELRHAFNLFDEDGDGFLSSDELRRALANMDEPMTEEEAHEMIRMADKDKDGLVSWEEFVDMIARLS